VEAGFAFRLYQTQSEKCRGCFQDQGNSFFCIFIGIFADPEFDKLIPGVGDQP
jgi:hypothetical protein